MRKNLIYIFVIPIIMTTLFMLLVLIPMHYFSFTSIHGFSMAPTLKNNGIGIVLNTRHIKKNDIIIFSNNKSRLIKRCVATGGDELKMNEGQLYVNNNLIKEDYLAVLPPDEIPSITLKKNEFFAMGDNRPVSHDCRDFGPKNYSELEGKLIFYNKSKYAGVLILVIVCAVDVAVLYGVYSVLIKLAQYNLKI